MEERARAAWEREAAALRSEIARLEREGRENDAGQGDADSDQRAALTRAMEVLTRQSGPGERWDEEKQQGPTMETRHSWLESRLEFLSELTGIHFHNYTWRKDTGVQGAVGRHLFSGECFSFSFQLEFELNETTVDGQTTASVSQLDVAVDSAPDDLIKFIARAEEEKSLMLLLRTIVSHSRWCALRRKTFAHFKARFPGVVLLPEGEFGSTLLIQNPAVPGYKHLPRFLVVWRTEVHPHGLVLPNIQLHVKTTQRMEEQGLGGLPEDAPRAFQTLLKLQGIETALACFVLSVQPAQ
ncbi:centromere protein P [Petromyzon marinus]|uniref:centromere protein P n=1 Tax=Petromyzon marinus TaxID=7757 RepID=UPI003F7238EF